MRHLRGFRLQIRGIKALSVLAMVIILLALLSVDIFLMHSQPEPSQQSAALTNPIVQENQRPGTKAWQMKKDTLFDAKMLRSPIIEGYSWKSSARAGDTVSFSVSTKGASFTAAIYRLGWYQGTGGRLLQTIPKTTGYLYPMPIMEPQTGLMDAGWPASFSIKIKPDWVTGMYIAKFTAADGTEAYAPFVVRSVVPTTFAYIHGDTTDQAYNPWGGKSLYDFNSTNQRRAYKVSFNRPLVEQAGFGNLLYWEYPMIRWLERNGYDLGYLASQDMQNNATLLKDHRGILIVGHSEYWTKEMRDNIEVAVNSGVNLANFAADTGSWQIRYESSPSSLYSLPDRVIVCYKDKTLDPFTRNDPTRVTVAFRDSLLNRPEQTLFGSMSGAYFTRPLDFPFIVADASSWVYAGTGLRKGDSLPGLVGYECDRIYDNVPVPAGLSVLSASPVYTSDRMARVCNATLHVASSGARIFNAATFKWSWGLDSFNIADGHINFVSISIQLMTQNILQNFLTGPDPG